MLLGGDVLGGAPLGSLPGGDSAVVVVGGSPAIVWRARAVVAGVDYSARLTGQITVDQEEGAASVASFSLLLPAGLVTPNAWRKRAVALDYIDAAGEQRLFTGRIIEPAWNRTTRIMACACTDALQNRVEDMPIEAIDSLVGGYWSEDVFSPTEGRSHLDYANERLSSRTASLDSSPLGSLRVTSWYAKAQADFEFGPGSTVYETIDVQLSANTRETNQVEIEADYRFPRLRQLNKQYSWNHSLMGGLGGESGFCAWLVDNADTPNVEMVMGAVSDSGQTMLSGPGWGYLPPSGIYCIPPLGFSNPYTGNLLAVSFAAARRWAQTVTERYALVVRADAAVAEAGVIVERDSLAIEVGEDAASTWESTPFGLSTTAPTPASNGLRYSVIGREGGLTPGRPADDGFYGHTDLRDEPRRQLGLRTKLNQAVVRIITAHRGALLSWDTPTSWVRGIDVVHTALINDQGVYAKGKVKRLRHRLDLAGGEAMTGVTIALMRGGGEVSDPLTPPAFTTEEQPEPPPFNPIDDGLPTQIGGRGEVYDDELDGFSGTWTSGDGISEGFPRRFQITADEVAAEQRDELTITIDGDYRLAIPNDPLELY
ncbi:hypothetical protein [Pseudomonas sp.]|uniref:hypothetical protein n=1 Tax=Pseudomonas sp. TaxID=306 RepID=UPI00272F7868|nr:hypothetical protein [Pseudomonas sp.]MDP2446587.1 hypothetical protein [Pseudomonas sp.]MDZ4334273.1 hypothetical protein [Pseudomonas sp.]